MKLSKKETIILFIQSYEKIMLGDKLAPIKFIFNEDAFSIFNNVLLDKDARYNIDICKILMIRNNNTIKENEIYIRIQDADLFFTKLQIVINLYLRYNPSISIYSMEDFITNYLWIKMTPYDFLNIYHFLDLQIAFLLNHNFFDFDSFKGGKKIGTYNKYDVYIMTEQNQMMWETYKRMYFKIYDKNPINSYELPSIHYGIEDNHACYIYAIQNMAIFKQDKKISRSLYKYSNDFIHPGFIISLKLMIDFLIDNGITDIKIPLLEVMNYSYHEFLSDKIKVDFNTQWVDYSDNMDEEELLEYQRNVKTYSKYVDRTNEISKTKVDTLAMIVDKVVSYYENIEMNIEDYMINLKIKEKTKKM